MKVAIVGASDKKERYSYKALKMLQEHGHEVYLIHPRLKVIEGISVYSSLSELQEECDTLTVYINANLSSKIEDEILSANFKRVIFNPGAENSDLEEKLKSAGVEVRNECTLVMLSLNNF